MVDSLGDRMKLYEGIGGDRILIPGLPVCVRLDGRSFHSFTKGLDRPYDIRLSDMMVETTKTLVEESHATIGYAQSDEITLLYLPVENEPVNFFAGRVQKLVSVLASIATAKFNELRIAQLPAKKKMATFDCRVWNLPSIDEAINAFRWREWDATKNSISMAASAYYSHSELQDKSGSDKQDLLMKKGINWNNYPAFFKRGTYVKRVTTTRTLTEDELKQLPEKHQARTMGKNTYTRSEVVRLDLPPITTITNIRDVFTDNAQPTMRTE